MRVIDLASLSLVGGSGIAETRIPLWWADGTTVSYSGSGWGYLHDGSTTTLGSSILFNLSSNFPTSLKYALEVTMYAASSSNAANAELTDASTGLLAKTQITTTSTTATVLRSNQITLTPGHSYGVGIIPATSSGTVYISDASLIVFPS